MKRTVTPYVLKDLPRKFVLMSGPRQCGKTTLAKSLYDHYDYLNYDTDEDRLLLKEKSWDRSKKLIIFDELHKKDQWKLWLKGIYDSEGIPPQVFVTGSAKLNTYRKVGDSMAGRYFSYHLHPLDLKEAAQVWQGGDTEAIFDRLMQCSGFPEPFLNGDQTYYKRWRRTHLDIILRQDLIDLYSVRDIQSIETLIVLLRKRVGACISYANLARDLERDTSTVKRWLTMLENLYIIFRVTPYHKNIARSLLKEPKFYFYDIALVDDVSARLENLVACALLKELDFLTDTTGSETKLYFLRTKEGKEIDFLTCVDDSPTYAIEVKTSSDDLSPHFKHFSKFLPDIKMIQLVQNLRREKTYPAGPEIRRLMDWLVNFNLMHIES